MRAQSSEEYLPCKASKKTQTDSRQDKNIELLASDI